MVAATSGPASASGRIDEHHRPLRGRDPLQQPVLPGQPAGQPQFQDADQLADRSGGT